MLGRVLSRLRRYLVTGLIVVAPVGVTAFVLVWLFQWLDSILGRHLPALGVERFPGLGLLALVVLLVFVGWMLRWAVGRKLVGWGNRLLSSLPLTRRIYNATSQIAQTVLARQEALFQSCALIEYPAPGSYTLAFVTARAPEEVEDTLGSDGVSVFLPTVPNPTTGYLLLLPAHRVRILDMSVEDGMKMVLSAGVVTPGDEDSQLAGLDLERLVFAGPPGERPARRSRWNRWRGGAEERPPAGEGSPPGDGSARGGRPEGEAARDGGRERPEDAGEPRGGSASGEAGGESRGEDRPGGAEDGG